MSDDLDDIRALSAEQEGRDPRELELERLARELHAEGRDLTIERGEVKPALPDLDTEHAFTVGTEDYLSLGIVSDPHLGSKYEQLSALRDFYHRASDAGVHRFLNAGDVTQGMYKDRQMAQAIHAHGADAQRDYAALVYPRGEDGQQTDVISGNHDFTFYRDSGINIVRAIAAQRDDLVYRGMDAAYLTIDEVKLYIAHPEGGGAYAKSYKPQKFTEAIPRGKGVQIVGIGHYHTWGTFEWQSVIALMLPCFQGQYPWLIRKGLYPTIGGVILEVWHDGPTITRVRHELIAYPERDNDWDHEASRSVERIV